MLTKRNYEMIAGIINNLDIPAQHRDTLVAELSSYFTEDNPRFDEGRFRIACAKEAAANAKTS